MVHGLFQALFSSNRMNDVTKWREHVKCMEQLGTINARNYDAYQWFVTFWKLLLY